MMSITRRQHHVWRRYLEAWATGNQIFCLAGERIFPANVANVAVERDFYKLQRMTDADIVAIRHLFKSIPTAAKVLMENFIVLFGLAGRLREAAAGNAALLAELDKQMITAEEDLLAMFEGNMTPIFDAIRRKDLSFYFDEEACGRFTHFLALQHLRTKGIKEQMFSSEADRPSGFSPERCWNVIRQVAAVNVGGSLLLEREKRPLKLLENDTAVPFITGDQPTLNLLAPKARTEMPRFLAFYYPVSPRIAIILDDPVEQTNYQTGAVSVEQVDQLNRAIHAAAHKQVFASSREALEQYL